MFKRKRIDLSFDNFKDMNKSNLSLKDLGWLGTLISDVGTFLAKDVGLALGVGKIGMSTLGAVLTVASLGWTIYSMCASKDRARSGGINAPNTLDYNGQLVNSRQASDPVRVIYGLTKTGGVWAFSKTSAENDEILNTVITWGEGEIDGVGTGIDSAPIYSGSDLNDFHTRGEFAPA